MRKAVIYARVSTQKQDYQRQVSELQEYADRDDILVAKIFSERISGTKRVAARKEGQELLNFIEAQGVNLVMVSEISRLGRSAIDVQTVVHELVERKVNVYIHQQSMYLLDKKGKYTPLSKLIIDTLANLAEMERETLVDRIHSGLAEAKRKGKQLGRPIGTNKSIKETKNYSKIKRLLREGYSIRNAAKIAEVSVNTVRKVKQDSRR